MAPLPRTPTPQDAEFFGSSHRRESKGRSLKDAMVRRQQFHRGRHYSDSVIVEGSDEKDDDDDEEVASETDDSTVDTQQVSRALRTIDRHASRRGLSRKQMIHILATAGKEATEATSVDTTVGDHSTVAEDEETRDAPDEGTLDGEGTIEETIDGTIDDEEEEEEEEDEDEGEEEPEEHDREERDEDGRRRRHYRRRSDSSDDDEELSKEERRYHRARRGVHEEWELKRKDSDFEKAAQSFARASELAQDSILDMVGSWVGLVAVPETRRQSSKRGSPRYERRSRAGQDDESSVSGRDEYTVDNSQRSERISVAKESVSVSIVDQDDTDDATSDPEEEEDEGEDEEGEEVTLELSGERGTYSHDDEYTYMTDDDDTIEEVFAAAMCSPRMRPTLVSEGHFTFNQEFPRDDDEEWTDEGTREYDDEEYTLDDEDPGDDDYEYEERGALTRNDQIRRKLGMAAAVLERVSKGIPMLRRRNTALSDDEESDEEESDHEEQDGGQRNHKDSEDTPSTPRATRVWVAPLRGNGSPPRRVHRSFPSRELNYDEAPSRLYSLIERRDWEAVITRARQVPAEAGVFIYRLNSGKDVEKTSRGDRSVVSFRSDTTTKAADNCVIRWRLLPLHAACIFRAPKRAVQALLRAHPAGVQMSDDGGKLPIHLACFSGASGEVLTCLLEAFPAGVETRDRKGRVPLDLVGKAQHVSEETAREARAVMLSFGAESDTVDPADITTNTDGTDPLTTVVKYGALSRCLSMDKEEESKAAAKKTIDRHWKIRGSHSREKERTERKTKKKHRTPGQKAESSAKTEGVEIAIEEEVQVAQSMPEATTATVPTAPTVTSRERLRSALAHGRSSQRKLTGMMKKAILRRFIQENDPNKKDTDKGTAAATEDEQSSTADDDEGSAVVEKIVLENGETEERSIRMLSTY